MIKYKCLNKYFLKSNFFCRNYDKKIKNKKDEKIYYTKYYKFYYYKNTNNIIIIKCGKDIYFNACYENKSIEHKDTSVVEYWSKFNKNYCKEIFI